MADSATEAADLAGTSGKRWFGLWTKRAAKTPGAPPKRKKDDIIIMGLGLVLGLTCALFPWYIFFNQEKFGVRALTFSGAGSEQSAPMSLSAQPQLVGKPMQAEEVPIMKLDLLATGTLGGGESDDEWAEPSSQPFPGDAISFRLVHVANGRAMIEDGDGLYVVQTGSRLPDQSRVAAIERREAGWVVVTSDDRVLTIGE